MARHAGWAALPALVAVIGLAAATTRAPGRGPTAAPAALAPPGALAVDPAVVRYRYPLPAAGAAPVSDDAAAIAALAARAAAGAASPLELAEYAELRARRGVAAGDPADLAAAARAAEAAQAALPGATSAPLTLARIASARHAFRDAIVLAQGHLARQPSAAAQLVLATAHLALGELPAAAATADAALDARPASGAYVVRALVHEAQGRDAEATHAFTRALAIEDHGAPAEAARARALWARFLLRRGAWADAGALLAEALRIAPDHALARALRAELALRTGDAAGARDGFEAAFEAGRAARHLIDRARAQALAGDAAGATATRAQAERLVRADLAAHGGGHQLELAELLLDRGGAAAVAEAVALARAEVAARPGAETRFQLARGLAAAGDHAAARAEVRRALASGVRDARLYELAARLERARGAASAAALYAAEAARLDPPPPPGAPRVPWRGFGLVVGGAP